jgi:hypothetical protein
MYFFKLKLNIYGKKIAKQILICYFEEKNILKIFKE